LPSPIITSALMANPVACAGCFDKIAARTELAHLLSKN